MNEETFYEYHCPCGYPKNNDGTCFEGTIHPHTDCACNELNKNK